MDSQAPARCELNGVLSLTFKAPAVEGEYLMEVAKSRWPVLTSIFCFDIACYIFRFLAKLVVLTTNSEGELHLLAATMSVTTEILPQLANMALLYTAISLLNRRSRKHGDSAARQEELLLSVLMAMAICNLLASLGAGAPQDYVYAAFFLICTSTFLKIRWWVGTLVLATPVVLLHMWQRGKGAHVPLPPDALVHVLVAWAVGGLMAYLSEWYRRQMFSSQCMAAAAHQKELLEAQARMRAQRQLAAAQAQAAQRALVVARDKAAHEAQIEFMSLMCHEVRTPLNGCLASAEMLLETNLCSEQRELANTIKVSGSILLSTVSNFLDFFKMEAGKTLDIVRTEIDLLQLVHDVHCIIEAMVGRNGEVQLLHPELTMCSESMGLDGIHHIVCDPDRVRGILLNLYTNAAKFTKQGHIGLRVQEVSGQHEPAPGDGYGKVTVTPAYQPLERAHKPLGLLAGKGQRDPGLAQQGVGRQELELDTDGPTGPESMPGSPSSMFAAGTFHGLPPPSSATEQRNAASGGGLAEEQAMAQNRDGVMNGAAVPGGRESDSHEPSRWLLFEVMDTGVGITQEGLHALFKEYCQGTEDDMRKPRSKGGTGLGLSICSKQVAVLGGRIGAYSSPDKGSVFWFTIPLILPASQHSSQPPPASVPGQMRNLPCPEPAYASTWPRAPPTRNAAPTNGSRSDVGWELANAGTGTGPPVGADGPGAVSMQRSMILQPHPAASHQYAVSQSRASLTYWPSSQPPGESGVTGPGDPDSMSAARRLDARCHRSLDMPQHFTMDTEQPSITQLLQQRLANYPSCSEIDMQGSRTHSPQSSGELFDQMPHTDAETSGYLYASMARSLSHTPPPASLMVTASDIGCIDGYHEGTGPPSGTHANAGMPQEAESEAAPAWAGRDSGGSMCLTGSLAFHASRHRDALGLPRLPSNLGVSSGNGRGSLGSSPVPSIHCMAPSSPRVAAGDARLPRGLLPSGLTGAAASMQQPQNAHSATASSPVLSALRGRRVLLVEDNLINQTVARKMLAGLGMQCMVASNGLEAVRAVQASMEHGAGASSFDVVLMDMMMPVMGGVEATKQIRELEAAQDGLAVETHTPSSRLAGSAETATGTSAPIACAAASTDACSRVPTGSFGLVHVPILAMTANASDRDREECRAAGMDGFLSKPVLKDRLADAILQVLAGGAWQPPSVAANR